MENTNSILQLCITDPQRALAVVLTEKNLQHFRYALSRGADPNAPTKWGNDDNELRSVFEQACQTAGSAKFIRVCLKNGANIRQPNKTGKFPIHFAASSADPDNVRVLLRSSPSLNCDVSYRGKTPLYTLFETMDQTNWERVFSCVKLLLDKRADINIPNGDGQTALGNFVTNSKNWIRRAEHWRKEVLKYCLQYTYVDFDAPRAGDQLRKNMADLFPDVSIPSYTMKTDLGILMPLLKYQTEEKFNATLRAHKNGINPAAWIDDKKKLIKAAVESGQLALVQRLMNNDLNFKLGYTLSELLAICCRFGYADILTFLLYKTGHSQHDVVLINDKPLLSITVKTISNAENKDERSKAFKCLECLLNDGRIDIDKIDAEGFSALCYAEKYKVDAAFDILLRNGAYIGTLNMFKGLNISEKNAEILKSYLDSCLTANNKQPEDENYEIKIDFSCLIPPMCKKNFTGERTTLADDMLPITYKSSSTYLKHLLKHPVISSFMLVKWMRLSLYFYINFVLCTLFCLSFVWYVVGYYGQENADPREKKTLRYVALAGATFISLREFIQVLLHWKMYFTSIENYMEILLVGTTYTVLLTQLNNDWRQIISSVVIMLSAIEVTLLVGQLPCHSISTYMVMLKTVSRNFLKCLAFYSILLVSFALCFHTLFYKNDSNDNKFFTFADVETALLKTLGMLTGELELSNFAYDNKMSYVVMVLFMFFVTIVMFNLMNGLAVSDTAAIEAEAEIIGFSQMVDVISKYENALTKHKSGKCFSKVIFQCFAWDSPLTLSPMPFITVAPNRSNTIYVPRPAAAVVTAGVTNSGFANDEESVRLRSFDDGSMDDLYEVELGCRILPSRMDGQLMERAKEIINSRKTAEHYVDSEHPVETRLIKLERDVERILEYLAK